ncbi:hypothetical protein D3C75_772020 [compost metagenome]
MAANIQLAKQRGLNDETIEEINQIHEHLEAIIDDLTLYQDLGELVNIVRQHEFDLQALWGFSQDRRYHTWVPRLLERHRELQYLGAVYRCKDSCESRTIGKQELHGGVLVGVGKGFIDFGGVVRIVGNLERIK